MASLWKRSLWRNAKNWVYHTQRAKWQITWNQSMSRHQSENENCRNWCRSDQRYEHRYLYNLLFFHTISFVCTPPVLCCILFFLQKLFGSMGLATYGMVPPIEHNKHIRVEDAPQYHPFPQKKTNVWPIFVLHSDIAINNMIVFLLNCIANFVDTNFPSLN